MFRANRIQHIATAVAALFLAFGILNLGPISAAHAAYTPRDVSAGGPPEWQVCDTTGGQLCMNRNRGGLSNGTLVIGWHEGDPNNDFQWVEIQGYCGSGHVTLTCPSFGNSNINRQFDGAVIVNIYSHGKCLALNSELQPCNADGTVDILTDCGGDPVTCGLSDVLNSYWTGKNRAERWVNFQNTLGTKIILDASTANLMAQLRSE